MKLKMASGKKDFIFQSKTTSFQSLYLMFFVKGFHIFIKSSLSFSSFSVVTEDIARTAKQHLLFALCSSLLLSAVLADDIGNIAPIASCSVDKWLQPCCPPSLCGLFIYLYSTNLLAVMFRFLKHFINKDCVRRICLSQVTGGSPN